MLMLMHNFMYVNTVSDLGFHFRGTFQFFWGHCFLLVRNKKKGKVSINELSVVHVCYKDKKLTPSIRIILLVFRNLISASAIFICLYRKDTQIAHCFILSIQ